MIDCFACLFYMCASSFLSVFLCFVPWVPTVSVIIPQYVYIKFCKMKTFLVQAYVKFPISVI